MKDGDRLQRFLFERLAVRGEIARLDAAWRQVLERRHYPPPIGRVLGESMAAAALLAATIKFDGLLTLQLQSRGPLRLLVVQCTSTRELRGLARWEGLPVETALEALCEEGTLVITIDPGRGQEPYQGIVSLSGASLAQSLEAYFARSEQLPTRLMLAADGHAAAGLLLQRLPGAASAEPDAWNRIERLGATLTEPELLGLEAREIVRRLFFMDDVRLFDAERIGFRCTCSRERTANMLRGLGRDEVQEILAEQGRVSVTCEFCGLRYEFDPVDAERLFAAALQPDVPATRH